MYCEMLVQEAQDSVETFYISNRETAELLQEWKGIYSHFSNKHINKNLSSGEICLSVELLIASADFLGNDRSELFNSNSTVPQQAS